MIDWAKVIRSPLPPRFELVGRFQGSEIVKRNSEESDAYQLITRKVGRSGGANAGQIVEGRLTQTVYETSIDRTTVEVMRAYEKALKAKGFELLYQCAGQECGARDFNHARSGRRFGGRNFVAVWSDPNIWISFSGDPNPSTFG